MAWVTTTYQREKLFEEVWAEPMRTLAKRYGISDVALKKICKKLSVPLPPQGYWARRPASRKGPRKPLPAFSDHPTILSKRYIVDAPVLDEAGLILANELNVAIPEDIPVPETLHSPHRFVDQARKAFKGMKPGEYGVMSCGRGNLDLRVSPANLGRALRIYSVLIKSMEALGWQVKIGGREDNETLVVILGENIRIGMEERVKRSDHVPTPAEIRKKARGEYVWSSRWDYHPNGELILKIDSWGGYGLRKTCTDTKNIRLEERLGEFLEIIRKFAANEILEHRRREREERERAAERARQAELQAKREAEMRRIQELEKEIDAWEKSKRILAFVEVARQSGQRDEEWGKWAMAYAERINPFRDDQR
ncbi:MAG TPA: hypothetical protein VGK27_06895 [Candidatus Deferrimicrobiaceae bacterium]|jgi:hypothetical protein